MTRPRYFRQYGFFPLVILFRTNGRYNERYWPAQIQLVTLSVCIAAFAAGLLALLQHSGGLKWGYASLMALAALVVVVQQVYYTRKGRNYFQLYRDQFGEDKETIAYLKEHHRG